VENVDKYRAAGQSGDICEVSHSGAVEFNRLLTTCARNLHTVFAARFVRGHGFGRAVTEEVEGVLTHEV